MIEQFVTSKLFVLDPARGKYGLAFAKFVKIDHKQLPSIRIEGDLKVFINKNDGKKS